MNKNLNAKVWMPADTFQNYFGISGCTCTRMRESSVYIPTSIETPFWKYWGRSVTTNKGA